MNRRITEIEENAFMHDYNIHGNNWKAIHEFILQRDEQSNCMHLMVFAHIGGEASSQFECNAH